MVEARRAGIDEVFRTPQDRGLRRLPTIARGALRLVRQAAPRELTGAIVLQLVTGVGVTVQLLLAGGCSRPSWPPTGSTSGWGTSSPHCWPSWPSPPS